MSAFHPSRSLADIPLSTQSGHQQLEITPHKKAFNVGFNLLGLPGLSSRSLLRADWRDGFFETVDPSIHARIIGRGKLAAIAVEISKVDSEVVNPPNQRG